MTRLDAIVELRQLLSSGTVRWAHLSLTAMVHAGEHTTDQWTLSINRDGRNEAGHWQVFTAPRLDHVMDLMRSALLPPRVAVGDGLVERVVLDDYATKHDTANQP